MIGAYHLVDETHEVVLFYHVVLLGGRVGFYFFLIMSLKYCLFFPYIVQDDFIISSVKC